MARLQRVALSVTTLVVAHQLVFLARYGSIYGEALAHAGHGQAWSNAVATVAVGGIALTAFALFGLVRLVRQVRGLADPRSVVAPIHAREFVAVVRRGARLTAGLVAIAVAGLTVQENLEHAAAGLGMPGLGILLSPEYPNAIWIVAGVALAVASVATLFGWRRAVLRGRLRELAAGRRWRRIATTTPRPPSSLRRPRTGVAARQLGLRAPPAALPA